MAHVIVQEYKTVPIADLSPHPDNPHRGDLAPIGESVRENGFYGAVLVQKSRMRIIAGEHRWYAAQAEGLTELPAILLDVDDATAKKILLADNRTAALGHDDTDALAAILSELDDLTGTGYTPSDLEDLERLIAPPDLDDVAGSLGDPTPHDGWTTIKIKAPRPVVAAWNEAVSINDDEPARVLADLLGVDWQWDADL